MHAVQTFELVLLLLGAVVALQWLAEKVGLPPSSALLVGGGALAFLPGIPVIELDPELALVLFLPPLLLDGAYFTAFGRFRRHLPGILSLAVGAVVFTTLVVGVAVHLILPILPWPACFALGAIVSPPDAVAARAVLQRVQLPRRLQALLEGESLLNDATGLVLFRFAVAATLSGVFSPGAAIGQFALLALGGVAVGIGVGYLWVWILRRLTNETLVVTTATLLCWVAYLAGEAVHVSGVIATVTAGLIFGWYQHVIMPAAVRLQGNAFWRTLTFCLEALVFILIGSSLRSVLDRAGGLEQVLTNLWGPILCILAAVVLARFVWVFATDYLLRLLCLAGSKRARPLGERQAVVLAWTGMRGVVTLAVALTLPADFPGRDFILVAAFAVILMTVVVQGSTLGLLIRAVKPEDHEPPAKVPLPQAEAAIARAKLAEAERHAYGPDGEVVHPQLLDMYQKRAAATEKYARDADGFMDNIRGHFDIMLKALAAGRATLIRLHRKGEIEDETLHNLERDLDLEELGLIYQREG
ncbi:MULTISPECIES: Na+/H+ antiporter [Sphingomonas]|uniref:Na+/H+ antiporter n=1 Tax=Sphingomonas TaxID=13687 RepID=UPI000DEF87F0|nr:MULTISPECIES: Na+/H+ antiporter [Sphingomonas]